SPVFCAEPLFTCFAFCFAALIWHLMQRSFPNLCCSWNRVCRADPKDLPNTGVGDNWESMLSSIFVSVPEAQYGTRSQSIILVDKDFRGTYFERYLDAAG